MCEVFNSDGSHIQVIKRAKLRELADKFKNEECWFGIEQEYIFLMV